MGSRASVGLLDYRTIFADAVDWFGPAAGRPFAIGLATAIATVWWLLLIRLLSTTAQKFVRTLMTISNWIGMRPRLAGAMLLPLGNGAPNLFSTLAATRNGNPQLAIGSAIGSSLFITTFVVSLVVFGAGSLQGKGMLWRDCAFALLASCAIFGFVLRERVRLIEPILLLCLYVIYVFVVSIGHKVAPWDRQRWFQVRANINRVNHPEQAVLDAKPSAKERRRVARMTEQQLLFNTSPSQSAGTPVAPQPPELVLAPSSPQPRGMGAALQTPRTPREPTDRDSTGLAAEDSLEVWKRHKKQKEEAALARQGSRSTLMTALLGVVEDEDDEGEGEGGNCCGTCCIHCCCSPAEDSDDEERGAGREDMGSGVCRSIRKTLHWGRLGVIGRTLALIELPITVLRSATVPLAMGGKWAASSGSLTTGGPRWQHAAQQRPPALGFITAARVALNPLMFTVLALFYGALKAASNGDGGDPRYAPRRMQRATAGTTHIQ
eukprot:SAG11_NODE_3987_length_2120_cov_1.977734_1_plen_492_part_00